MSLRPRSETAAERSSSLRISHFSSRYHPAKAAFNGRATGVPLALVLFTDWGNAVLLADGRETIPRLTAMGCLSVVTT